LIGRLAGKLARKTGRKGRGPAQRPAGRHGATPIRIRKTKTRKTVNVGIDFGTSSSKIAVRDVDLGMSYLIPLRPERRGCDQYLFPSTVLIREGRLYFGEESAGPESTLLRSFKICVACGGGAFAQTSCDATFRSCSGSPGVLKLDGDDVIAADRVAAWYLGYLMNLAENTARRHFGDEVELVLTFNSAVPINHLEQGKVRRAFERAVLVAHAIRAEMSQGIELQRARALTDDAESLSTLPDEADRQAFILAEPLASVISYIRSPLADEGFHCIVDIGAGTTDVAFFKRWTVAGDPKVAFYYCDNHLVGGDDVDYALARHLNDIQPGRSISELVTLARSAKEAYSNGGGDFETGDPGTVLGAEELKNLVAPIRRKVVDGCRETWRDAYRKERKETAWKQYDVFVIGGSARFQPLRLAGLEKPWTHITRIKSLNPLLPDDFTTLDGADGELLSRRPELFAVTYGVSRHCAEWPDFYRPMDVSIYEIPKPKLVPTWEQNLNQD
jgi:hypothetical protein